MAIEPTGTPDYTMGFSEWMLQSLRRYTAQASAGHLLPYLRPGMHVLDFGCGPGTISAGLARRIAPGELHGVDMEESQIELARDVAEAYGQKNARFHVGDVTALPFEDDYFDVGHCHNVLMHVPDTQAVLSEIMRVMKPGGILSCREMICESSFSHPDFGVIGKAWDMFADLLEADEGHAEMGKDMKGHILEAGYENLRMSASFDTYSAPEDIEFIYGLANEWFLSPEITEAAIKYGAATEKLCQDIADAYEKWREHPGAMCCVAFGEAIANKPYS